MYKTQRLDHARHNKEVCSFLKEHKHGVYDDWIVTTSFYSALHFVLHNLFPNTFIEAPNPTKKYPNFDALWRDVQDEHYNKHQFTCSLVKEYLDEIYAEYKFLMDTCHTARYSNYKLDAQDVLDAISNLQTIESACVEEEA